MSNTKHTPGPWFIQTTPHEVKIFSPVNSRVLVADLSWFAESFPDLNEEAEANAKLIAAAPELLTENEQNVIFLEWLADQKLNLWSDKMQWLYQRIAKTKAAIKKATS